MSETTLREFGKRVGETLDRGETPRRFEVRECARACETLGDDANRIHALGMADAFALVGMAATNELLHVNQT